MCESLCGDGYGKEMCVGIFRGKKGKRKMERRYEKKKNGSEIEIKINGDVYGKNKLVEEEMRIGVEFT